MPCLVEMAVLTAELSLGVLCKAGTTPEVVKSSRAARDILLPSAR